MKVILKNYVTGRARESDMEVVATDQEVELKVQEGTKDAVVLQNLYLSCYPAMRSRITKHDSPSYVPDFVAGEVNRAFGAIWTRFGALKSKLALE